MYNTALIKKVFILCGFFMLFSCDKDFNVVGEGLIGASNFKLDKYYSAVKAYNQSTGAVQSDNLLVNAFGTYTNAAFGTTSASIAAQLSLASVPTIGANAVMDSVVMTVPYFSTVKSTDATTGIRTYKLDSIYGTSKAPFKLSVYESGYFMRDLDPATNFKERQSYYSNQKNDFEALKVGSRLNDAADTKQNDAFYFDPIEIAEKTFDEETKKSSTKRSAPAMRLKLSNAFFTTKILNAPAAKLSADAFKNYFRGLYFKVEKTGADDSMAIMNFKKAGAGQNVIRLYYKEDLSTTTNGVTTVKRVNKTLDLNIDGTTVNFLEESNLNPDYSNAITNFNPASGDSKLYLKGGVGSLAVLELFGADNDNNGVADELEKIRKNGWLINEANLVFHIDAAAMKNSVEPNRIYVYNLTNKTPILDYITDKTELGTNNGKFDKFIFGGALKKEDVTNGRGLMYKVRITDQIKNLIKNADSTNVKLGVVVTETIKVATFNKLKTSNSILSSVPTASVLNPHGTVLFGGHPAVPEDKRLRLEIIYTKPNQ